MPDWLAGQVLAGDESR